MTEARRRRKLTEDNIKMKAVQTRRRFVSENESNYQDGENVRSLKSENSWQTKRLPVSQGRLYAINLAMLCGIRNQLDVT